MRAFGLLANCPHNRSPFPPVRLDLAAKKTKSDKVRGFVTRGIINKILPVVEKHFHVEGNAVLVIIRAPRRPAANIEGDARKNKVYIVNLACNFINFFNSFGCFLNRVSGLHFHYKDNTPLYCKGQGIKNTKHTNNVLTNIKNNVSKTNYVKR